MQVFEELQVALFLVMFTQPVNHQLPALEVYSLDVVDIHCINYVTPVFMIKEDTISRVYNDLSGLGSLKQTLADSREEDPSIKLDDVRNGWKRIRRESSSSKGRTASWLTGLIMSTD